MTRRRKNRLPTIVASVTAFLTLAVALGGLYLSLLWVPAPSRPHLTGTVVAKSLSVDGHARTYTAYIPRGLPAGSPLLVALHGSFEDGAALRRAVGYRFDALADTHRFAVAYPDAYRQSWNDCRRTADTPARREAVDDKSFISTVAADLNHQFEVDDGHIYLAGYSNGGQMAYRLASEMPGRVAGLAVVAANVPADDNNLCPPFSAAVPVLTIAGTKDPISPFSGGEVSIFGFAPRGRVLSAAQTVDAFVALNGLTGISPSRRTLPHAGDSGSTTVTETRFEKPGTKPVVQYVVDNGGHVIPGAAGRYRRVLGPVTPDLDGPGAIVAFFSTRF